MGKQHEKKNKMQNIPNVTFAILLIWIVVLDKN